MAQLDSASDSDSEGPRFESARAGQKRREIPVVFLSVAKVTVYHQPFGLYIVTHQRVSNCRRRISSFAGFRNFCFLVFSQNQLIFVTMNDIIKIWKVRIM